MGRGARAAARAPVQEAPVRDGRVRRRGGKAALVPLNDAGDRLLYTSAKWYGEYADGSGVTRRVPLSANRSAAEQMLAELEQKQRALRETLLRISGAIQVLEEELGKAAEAAANGDARGGPSRQLQAVAPRDG